MRSLKRTQYVEAYLVRIYNKGSTKVGAVTFIAHPKRDQENALMRHVVGTGFRGRLQIIAVGRGARLDDRGIAKLRRQPVHLWEYTCDVGEYGWAHDSHH